MDKTDPYIRTFTDREFHFLNFTAKDIHIEDIAHALSNICRYGGHCKKFYCPTMDQRILTGNLPSIPSADFNIAAGLVGFDEHPIIPGSTGHKRRRFRPSIITHGQAVKRRVYRIEMENGQTIRASAEHPWLIATKQSRNQVWCTSEQISKAVSEGRNRYMHKFLDPWQTIDNRDAGWLAGMFDGEGYLSIKNRRGILCCVSQNPGSISDKLEELLTRFGFDYGTTITGKSTNTHSVRGGYRGILQLLGSIRPHRLIKKFNNALVEGEFTKQLDGKGVPTKIVRVYDEGIQWVAGIETSTHTYLCEGFGSHNSVAEHSIRCCDDLVTGRGLEVDWSHRIWGLLHDAAEAYIGDLPKPFKDLLSFNHQEVSQYEDRILKAVAERFGLPWPLPDRVYKTDRALFDEEMKVLWNDWTATMTPREAEAEFLSRFRTLNDKRATNLSTRDRDIFLDAINENEEPNEVLRRAAEKYNRNN
jgi:5'-deoxynucleotidase YfbR-like HD superfamily hydrolase